MIIQPPWYSVINDSFLFRTANFRYTGCISKLKYIIVGVGIASVKTKTSLTHWGLLCENGRRLPSPIITPTLCVCRNNIERPMINVLKFKYDWKGASMLTSVHPIYFSIYQRDTIQNTLIKSKNLVRLVWTRNNLNNFRSFSHLFHGESWL